MLKLQVTAQFKKDYKKCAKRGLDMALLHDVLGILLNEQPLPDKYRDHALTASRTGTHSDLFGK